MTVTIDRADHTATITLRRPEVKNALDLPTVALLTSHLRAAAADPLVRAILLTGEGGAFCSGADLRSFDPSAAVDPAAGIDAFHALTRAIVSAPQAVVALVDGPAVGFGANLALCSDLVVATERAYFQMAFVRLGLVSDGGGTWLLPRLVGTARAMEMLLLAEKIPAARALEWGLVNRVVPPHEGAAEAQALCERIVRGPARAIARLKRVVRASASSPLDAALDAEKDAQLDALSGPELPEGVLAFLEKRPPDFRKVPR